MPADTLPAKVRRAVLLLLTRERLGEIASSLGLDVADRRSKDSYVDALVRSRTIEFRAVLRLARRDELKGICRTLGLDDSGREIEPIVERILAMAAPGAAQGAEAFALAPDEPRAARARTAQARPRGSNGEPVGDYRHDETRKNNPPAGLVDLDKPPPKPTKAYAYDPHLDPRLEWAGKAEHGSFEVDTVSLHIHERISAQAIVRAVKREDAQRSLFAETQLDPSKEVDFYAHEVGWANRLVLGDSLLVMSSLLEREQMAGKVQCIYVDPPYGVNYRSNFQPLISRKDVKEDDSGLTREPEMIQAYRDTWTLGIHSYLTYLRDRLLLARELLSESGSIFVQISDENVHHVRELMDEVFGRQCFIVTICVKKKGSQKSGLIDPVNDYLLWYGRRPRADGVLKHREVFESRALDFETLSEFRWVELPGGAVYPLREVIGRNGEKTDYSTSPRSLFRDHPGARLMRPWPITNGGERVNQMDPVVLDGSPFDPPRGRCWSYRSRKLEGEAISPMERLAASKRLYSSGKSLDGKRYLDDFPFKTISNWWDGLGGAPDPVYVVQTNTEIVKRCILMTTDPGDLVLDPTCGSGTTAFVAEQWGRRWITCDSSRVALAIARERLLTARFPFYRLRTDRVRDGFNYMRVARIQLGDIANSARLDACTTQEERDKVVRDSAEQETLYDQPEENKAKVRVSGPFTVEAIPVAALDHEGADTLEPEARQDDVARSGRGVNIGRVTDEGGDYVDNMIGLLKRSSGVHFKNGKSLALPTLRPVKTANEWLHAESETGIEGDPRLVAVSFGPRHGPVTPKQVVDAIQQTRGYDIVLFVGFACDPEAGRIIEGGAPKRELQFVHAAPDILVQDLLKTTKTTKLFTVFGLPDVKVKKEKDGEITVTLTGIDIYDPTTPGRRTTTAARTSRPGSSTTTTTARRSSCARPSSPPGRPRTRGRSSRRRSRGPSTRSGSRRSAGRPPSRSSQGSASP